MSIDLCVAEQCDKMFLMQKITAFGEWKNSVSKLLQEDEIMVFYLSVVIVAMAIIATCNIFFNPMVAGFSPFWTVAVVVIAVVVEIILNLIIEGIVHIMPDGWFDEKSHFKTSAGERKFYDKIKIKKWKDKVWELGAVGGFSKRKMLDPNSSEYLRQFIIECNKGFVGHIITLPASFLIMLFPLPKYWLCLGLPVAVVSVFLNTLPAMILRYNLPKLQIAHKRAFLKETSQKKENVNENDISKGNE